MKISSNPEDIFIITLSVSLILFSLVHHVHYNSKDTPLNWTQTDKIPLRDKGDFAPVEEEYKTDKE